MVRFCENIGDIERLFTPRNRYIIEEDEIRLVRKLLEIDKLTDEELCHLRNVVVVRLSNGDDVMREKISAVTVVIDDEKWRRGLEV